MSGVEPDPQAILAALGCSEGVEAIVPVEGGFDAAIWRVERGGHPYALRLFGVGKDALARREEAAMRLTAPGVPIPAVHASGVWQERPALLIDWCAGQTLRAALRATPHRAWALARAFGATQAHLHVAPAPPHCGRMGARGSPGPGEGRGHWASDCARSRATNRACSTSTITH